MPDSKIWYSCLNGHSVCAVEDHTDVVVDLTLHYCPVCLGRIPPIPLGRTPDGAKLLPKQ